MLSAVVCTCSPSTRGWRWAHGTQNKNENKVKNKTMLKNLGVLKTIIIFGKRDRLSSFMPQLHKIVIVIGNSTGCVAYIKMPQGIKC